MITLIAHTESVTPPDIADRQNAIPMKTVLVAQSALIRMVTAVVCVKESPAQRQHVAQQIRAELAQQPAKHASKESVSLTAPLTPAVE